LAQTQRYVFKGWQHESDFNNKVENPELIDLSTVKLHNDLNYFAYYEVEDVLTNASDLVLFDISRSNVTAAGESKSAFHISIKEEYRNIVGGRITLPSTDAVGNVIEYIKDFNSTPLVTEVHFLSNAQYVAVADSAFHSSSVQSVYLPGSITRIGNNAFFDNYSLKEITLNDNITVIGTQAFSANNKMQVHIAKLPTALTTLGERSFYNAGPNVTISTLPAGVKEIPVQCFMNCNNLCINYFPPGEGTCVIGSQAFYNCGKVSSLTDITINAPWTLGNAVDNLKGKQIFYGGYTYVTDVNVYGGLVTEDTDALEYDLFGEMRDNVTIGLIQS